jgi:mannose-6-phosphate isomerase
MHPLLFAPVYRRYVWGGRRFATSLGRSIPAGDDFAESWELVDRAADQSVVAAGPLRGKTLGELVHSHGPDLLGRHAPLPRFPLLFKFLDACRDLSVQVHPDDARAARLSPPDRGKTEAWYVIDAAPGSRIYAGLRTGTTRAALAAAIEEGRCGEVLHSFEPQAGDCVFIPAGTVHAIGAGLLVAEIQQSSDVTYRLFDWNRVSADGRPRPLHVAAGLEAVTHFEPVIPTRAADRGAGVDRRLVASEFFVLDEVLPHGRWTVGGDDGCHFLAVVSGRLRMDPDWGLPDLSRGSCVLVPAVLGPQMITAEEGTRLLHVSLP